MRWILKWLRREPEPVAELYCQGCGQTVLLTTTKKGTVTIFDEKVEGWTFTSDRGWRCPTCMEVLGAN